MRSLCLIVVVLLAAVASAQDFNLNSPSYDFLERGASMLEDPSTAPSGVQPVIVTPQLAVPSIASLSATKPATNVASISSDNEQTEDDPEMIKLKQAQEAVKEDIMGNAKQIGDERKWIEAVRKIIAAYTDKVGRVHDHITALRREQRKLFFKKKQIDNLMLQRRLEAKLKDANDEMSTLKNTLDRVQQKSHELTESHESLQTTIIKLEKQLGKLRGGDSDEDQDQKAAASTSGTAVTSGSSGDVNSDAGDHNNDDATSF